MTSKDNTGEKRQRRNSFEVIADMIRNINGQNRTQVMYSNSLSHSLTSQYLDTLTAKKFIELIPGDKDTYQITSLGKLLLERIEQLLVIWEAD